MRLLGGSRRNSATPFGMEILAWCGYPIVKKFRRYVYSFWQNSQTWQTDRRTDRQTDTACRHIPRLCIASYGKNQIRLKFRLEQTISPDTKTWHDQHITSVYNWQTKCHQWRNWRVVQRYSDMYFAKGQHFERLVWTFMFFCDQKKNQVISAKMLIS